jgi:hypothetical protein
MVQITNDFSGPNHAGRKEKARGEPDDGAECGSHADECEDGAVCFDISNRLI